MQTYRYTERQPLQQARYSTVPDRQYTDSRTDRQLYRQTNSLPPTASADRQTDRQTDSLPPTASAERTTGVLAITTSRVATEAQSHTLCLLGQGDQKDGYCQQAG